MIQKTSVKIATLLATIAILLASSALIPAVFASSPVQVVNVTAHVVNDEDSGQCGYWALDHYNKQISISLVSGNIYLVNESFEGFWQTFAGALSPGSANCATPLEGTTASGTFQGSESFYVSGTLSPTAPTHGFISCNSSSNCQGSAFNFGGSASDILKLTYGSQTGDLTYTDMLSFYIPGYAVLYSYPSPFYFAYHYQGQSWIDASSGITGNIVT